MCRPCSNRWQARFANPVLSRQQRTSQIRSLALVFHLQAEWFLALRLQLLLLLLLPSDWLDQGLKQCVFLWAFCNAGTDPHPIVCCTEKVPICVCKPLLENKPVMVKSGHGVIITVNVQAYLILWCLALLCFIDAAFFFFNGSLWQPCFYFSLGAVLPTAFVHFVSVSHFDNSCDIWNFFIICCVCSISFCLLWWSNQWSLMLLLWLF